MLYKAVQYKKFQCLRRFGIELETGCTVTKQAVKKTIKANSCYDCLVSKYQLTGDSNFWHIKDDATCGPAGRNGPKGVEIASFVGSNTNDLNHMCYIAEKLKERGSVVNDNCGFHIHAEAKDLTTSQIGTLMAYWVKIEPVLAYSVPNSRLDNIYCKTFNDMHVLHKNLLVKYSAQLVWELLRPRDLSYYENEDRRRTLNLVNYTRALQHGSEYRKTIELRWPEGTLNARDIRCWVVLFLSFIDTCKDLPMPKNLTACNLIDTLKYLGFYHDKKTFSIFDQNLFDTKSWFLERILKNPFEQIFPNDPVFLHAANTLSQIWHPIKKF